MDLFSLKFESNTLTFFLF